VTWITALSVGIFPMNAHHLAAAADVIAAEAFKRRLSRRAQPAPLVMRAGARRGNHVTIDRVGEPLSNVVARLRTVPAGGPLSVRLIKPSMSRRGPCSLMGWPGHSCARPDAVIT